MRRRRICADCTRLLPHAARGLCGACYARHRKAGTVDVWPYRSARNEGQARAPIGENLSYRQLDHWTRRGFLHPRNANPGSGGQRTWTDDEVAVARTMARLAAAGMSLDLAHRVARSGPGRHEVRPGVFVEVA